MDEHLKAAAKQRATSTDPVALKKRIRELERELQTERTKRAKLDLLQAPDSPPDDASETASASSSSSDSSQPPYKDELGTQERVIFENLTRISLSIPASTLCDATTAV